jgi:hypothetical protein
MIELCLEMQLCIQIVKTRLGWRWGYCKPIYGLGRSGEEATVQSKEGSKERCKSPTRHSIWILHMLPKRETITEGTML